jgi:hypothetical protein
VKVYFMFGYFEFHGVDRVDEKWMRQTFLVSRSRTYGRTVTIGRNA